MPRPRKPTLPGIALGLSAAVFSLAVGLSQSRAGLRPVGEAAPEAAGANVEDTPLWAFIPVTRDQHPHWSDRSGVFTLPGSDKHLTQVQIDDLNAPPDWYPKAHPAPPAPVVKGGTGLGFACAACHLMSGMGVPQSASLAGLPTAYILRQFEDFKSGARHYQAVTGGKPVPTIIDIMNGVAKARQDVDMKATADYFSKLKPKPWVTVVEAQTVPKTFQNGAYRLPVPTGETEPLGDRIVELGKDSNRMLLRDPNLGTIAYVPVGAVARGNALVAGGSQPCASCHGPALKGIGEIPSIAGRSPLYVFRQLYLFRHEGRKGEMASLMYEPVKDMSQRDMIAVSAYLATLKP